MLKTKLEQLTLQKLVFIQSIKDTLSHSSTFIYHKSNKTLWIDLNISKELGFEIVIFHTSTNKTLLERY